MVFLVAAHGLVRLIHAHHPVGNIVQMLFGRLAVCLDGIAGRAAGHDGDDVFPMGKAFFLRKRLPADFFADFVVFRSRCPEHLPVGRHVRHPDDRTGDIAYQQAVEPPNGRIGLVSRPLMACLVIKAEHIADRPVDHDDGLPSRRRAGILYAVRRIGHDFRDGKKKRHVLRPASCHDAVDGHLPDV